METEMPTLETVRLILREWTLDDFEDFRRDARRPEGDGVPRHRRQAAVALRVVAGDDSDCRSLATSRFRAVRHPEGAEASTGAASLRWCPKGQ
jgi:hypothetical protein